MSKQTTFGNGRSNSASGLVRGAARVLDLDASETRKVYARVIEASRHGFSQDKKQIVRDFRIAIVKTPSH